MNVPSSGVTQLNLATIDVKMAGIGHMQEAGTSSNPSFTPDVEADRHLSLASPLYTIHTAGYIETRKISLTSQNRDLASGAEW